ncbi:MAG TPA: hypothetical protein VLZ07_04705 [Syntrophales bacterium]|nr:hypothetical protein [Syntrophales bacterium]
MFQNIPLEEKELIYMGLKKLISSNTGRGFRNGDQGNALYVMGSQGKLPDDDRDLPGKHVLFKMLRELSDDFKAKGHTIERWWYDFSSWKNFCTFAIESFKKCQGKRSDT